MLDCFVFLIFWLNPNICLWIFIIHAIHKHPLLWFYDHGNVLLLVCIVLLNKFQLVTSLVFLLLPWNNVKRSSPYEAFMTLNFTTSNIKMNKLLLFMNSIIATQFFFFKFLTFTLLEFPKDNTFVYLLDSFWSTFISIKKACIRKSLVQAYKDFSYLIWSQDRICSVRSILACWIICLFICRLLKIKLLKNYEAVTQNYLPNSLLESLP